MTLSEGSGKIMVSFMAFLSYFVSYLLLFAIMVVLAGMGIFIGIKWRKAKDAKLAAAGVQEVKGSSTQS